MVWLFDVLRKHINSELNRLQPLNVYERVAHIAFDATQYPEESSAEDKTKQHKNVFNVQVKKREQRWRSAGNSKRKLEHKLTEHILHVSVCMLSCQLLKPCKCTAIQQPKLVQQPLQSCKTLQPSKMINVTAMQGNHFPHTSNIWLSSATSETNRKQSS